MSQRRILLFQTLIEAVIPVIGYFEWGWDLSFILLFYLLDYVLAFGMLIAKGRKRLAFSASAAERKLFLRKALAGFVLMAAACAGVAAGIVFLDPKLDWSTRIVDFLAYRDTGIAQGYVLVPLLLLNGILVYRQQFVMTARFRTYDMAKIMQPFVTQGLILLGGAGLLMGIASLVAFPQELLIGILVVGTAAYRYRMRSV